MSLIYKKKMEIRERRSEDRATLEKAKEILEQRNLRIQKGSADYIKTINKIKKEIKKTQMSLNE
jgi:hypothetical protein